MRLWVSHDQCHMTQAGEGLMAIQCRFSFVDFDHLLVLSSVSRI